MIKKKKLSKGDTIRDILIELMSAYTLYVSGNDNNTRMIDILKNLDSRLLTNKFIHPIYEPSKGDLVFFKDGNIGIMENRSECIYYNKAHDYMAETSIVFDENVIKVFGRVDTTKRSKTVLKQHIKHFQKYVMVRSIIEDASLYYNVPKYMVKTIIYNESKFDNSSKSYTGVTGIGMFTDATAKQFSIDKTSVESQIYGVAKVLKHHYENLPDYYSNSDRWRLSALIYNRGKGVYFKAKRALTNHNVSLTYENILNQINKYAYGKEGYQYVKRLNMHKHMFE